jgi:hypothetical protein
MCRRRDARLLAGPPDWVALRSAWVRGCLVARGRMDGASGSGQGPGFEGEMGPLGLGCFSVGLLVNERASPRGDVHREMEGSGFAH